jgi:hypothetical protein
MLARGLEDLGPALDALFVDLPLLRVGHEAAPRDQVPGRVSGPFEGLVHVVALAAPLEG